MGIERHVSEPVPDISVETSGALPRLVANGVQPALDDQTIRDTLESARR